MAICKDFGGIGDGECCATIFGLGIEFGDDLKLSVTALNADGGEAALTSYDFDDSCKHRDGGRSDDSHDILECK